MENTHIKPFAAAIENGIEMVMAAHLHCTCFDEKVIPASLSINAVSYLRNKLKFNGVIISDDMMMKGVSQFGLADAFEQGIRAGLNMFIHRNSTHDAGLFESIERSSEKIMLLKKRFALLN